MQYVSVEAPPRAATAPPGETPALRWRPFVVKFVSAALGVIAAIGLLNFLVNPEGMFAPKLLPPVTWNTRPAKAELLAEANPKPEALLLGSSRVMTIPPAEIERRTGLRTFNAGVNAAYTEDLYVLLRFAVERAGVQPKLVLIGLDAEAFHDHEPENDYLSQPNELASFLIRNEAAGAEWRRFTTLWTVYQTKLSLVSLYDRLGGKKINAVDFAPDGAMKEDPWLRQRAKGNYDLGAHIAGTAREYTPRYKSFTGISPDRLEYFAAALRYARARGARVVVFATPIHPQLEQSLASYGYEQRKYDVYAAARAIAAREGAEFVDLSAPASFGGEPDHFYDGVHLDAYNADRLIGAVLRTNAVQ